MKRTSCDFNVDELLHILHYDFPDDWNEHYATPLKVLSFRMDLPIAEVRNVIKRARERADGLGLLIMNNGNDSFYIKERYPHEGRLLP